MYVLINWAFLLDEHDIKLDEREDGIRSGLVHSTWYSTSVHAHPSKVHSSSPEIATLVSAVPLQVPTTLEAHFNFVLCNPRGSSAVSGLLEQARVQVGAIMVGTLISQPVGFSWFHQAPWPSGSCEPTRHKKRYKLARE